MKSIHSILRYARCFVVLVCAALASCNGDIFVDPVDTVLDSITLSGDMGSASLYIQRKGLDGVSFGNNVDSHAEAFMYDHEGNIISRPSSIDDVDRILYSSHRFAVEFKIHGDKVDVTALDNAYLSTIDVQAYLSYGYTTRTITFHIGQGRPLEIEHIGCNSATQSVGTFTDTGIPQTYNNNTDQPLKILVYPYKVAYSSITLTPGEGWVSGVSGTISVPSCVNGEWNDNAPDEVDVTIGQTTGFYSATTDVEEAAYVDVPPHSSVKYRLSVTYATLEAKYNCQIRLPNSELNWPANGGDWKQLQPIAYNIEILSE